MNPINSLADLSIIIVTWNNDLLLTNCLNSINLIYNQYPEIIVVDNANSEQTKQICIRYKNLKYVSSCKNLGFAGGNNLGLRYCSKKYVLLLNNDTVIKSESFSKLLDFLSTHPNVSVVQGTMNLPYFNDTLDMCGGMFTPLGIVYPLHFMHSTQQTTRQTRPVFIAKGAFLMFKKSIINHIGGNLFYDHFKSNYEESDFCHRVWLSGNEVYFVETSPIDHLMGQTVNKIPQVEFLSQDMSNQLFSWLTLFSTSVLWRLIPKYLIFRLLICLRFAVTFKFNEFHILIKALSKTYARRQILKTTREKMQKIRKVTDENLLPKILVKPHLNFYWHWLRGTIDKYSFNNYEHKSLHV